MPAVIVQPLLEQPGSIATAWARPMTSAVAAVSSRSFRAALEADPDDGPAAVYLERATEYAAAPPPPDWDFVVRRTQK